MPVPSQPTASPPLTQQAPWTDEAWASEIVALLPPGWAAQAQALGAFRRVRKLASPTALVRALLVFALDHLSTRGLGVWGVLTGVGDLSEAAWRRRLRRARPWLSWLLAELLTVSVVAAPALAARGRRIRLVDATRLAQVGGCGDDWRVHLSYDLLAGRMDAVRLTDRHTAESLAHGQCQAGDIMVADSGYGHRQQVALARQAGADVVLRIDPRTCPLEDAAGQPFDVEAWVRGLARKGVRLTAWTGWCVVQEQRYPVRLIASALPPAQRRQARRRKRRRAKDKGRPVSVRTLRLVGWWLLLTTLEAVWTAAEIVQLYRARWQVEMLFKRLKQLLAGQALRARTPVAAEATVQALLVAWALQERLAARVLADRAREGPAALTRPLSLWRLADLSLRTLAQTVRGGWTVAQVEACLPRLARFLHDTPRRRLQQAASVGDWLAAHPGRVGSATQEVAA